MTGKRGTKTGQKYHNDYEKAAAVMLLSMNKNDYEKVAQMIDVSPQTLRNWEKETLIKNMAIPAMLEITIKRLLEMMPHTWTGNTWAVAFGILMDKWLLVHGQPTARTESILTDIDGMNEKDKQDVLAEAEKIIREATGRRPDSSTSE